LKINYSFTVDYLIAVQRIDYTLNLSGID